MAKIKIQTGLRVDEDTYQKLKALADSEGRSINNMVEHIIRQYLATYEKEHGSIPLDDLPDD